MSRAWQSPLKAPRRINCNGGCASEVDQPARVCFCVASSSRSNLTSLRDFAAHENAEHEFITISQQANFIQSHEDPPMNSTSGTLPVTGTPPGSASSESSRGVPMPSESRTQRIIKPRDGTLHGRGLLPKWFQLLLRSKQKSQLPRTAPPRRATSRRHLAPALMSSGTESKIRFQAIPFCQRDSFSYSIPSNLNT